MNTQPYIDTIERRNSWANQLIPQRRAWLYEQLKNAGMRMGQRQTDSDIFAMALKDLEEELTDNHGHYSLSEIESVLNLGSKGKLGDNTMIATKIIFAWLERYKSEYRPKLASKHAETMQGMPAPEKVRELTRKEAIDHLREVYEDYHEGHIVLSRSYDIAVQFDLIPEKHRDLEKHLPRATALLSEDKAKQLSKGRITRTDYLESISNAESGSPLDQKCRVLALGEWFDWMKLGRGFQLV